MTQFKTLTEPDATGLGRIIYEGRYYGVPAPVVKAIETAQQQLAECQAREKVLRDALNVVCEYVPDNSIEGDKDSLLIDNALALPSDSAALDTMLKAAKRDMVAAVARNLGWEVEELERRVAKELE